MDTNRKIKISKMDHPAEQALYNAQILLSTDGEHFWYCGCGKYCRTLPEAMAYAESQDPAEIIIVRS